MPRLRIISGKFGGRLIVAPTGRTTHPMGDRVRSALFNMIDVKGARVLDAYAGSGAVGFEALSRGAKQVDFIEKDKKAQQSINENIAVLDVVENTTLFKMSVKMFIKTHEEKNLPKYDVIFADPPYHQIKTEKDFSTALELKKLVKPKGLMILSYSGRVCMPTVNGVVVVDKRRYGEAALALFRFE